ncbi:MAG TPA: PP2C family protein-serine/threonine phosphatase [Jatrophihabitans sp.]|nr:PP2C family protein-serine/threonine phosphatase [Jatrophihabitans sp.]
MTGDAPRVALVHNGEPPTALVKAFTSCRAVVIAVDFALARRPDWQVPTPKPQVLLLEATVSPAAGRRLRRALWGAEDDGLVVVYDQAVGPDVLDHLADGADCLLPPFEPRRVASRLFGLPDRVSDDHLVRIRYEQELEIAREIQLGFLPQEIPVRNGWDLGVRYLPARDVGGDFYDVFELVQGRRIALVIADVCDKGVGAALFMTLIRSLLHHSAEQAGARSTAFAALSASSAPAAVPAIPTIGSTSLATAVSATNDYLVRNHVQQAYFATLFFAVLDPLSGLLTYINGGHNPPFVVRARTGDEPAGCEQLEPTGPAIGVGPASFEVRTTVLNPGDTLFAYTDGVTEATNGSGDQFGEDALRSLLQHSARSGEGMLGEVYARVRGFAGGAPQSDDVTMVLAHRWAEENSDAVRHR